MLIMSLSSWVRSLPLGARRSSTEQSGRVERIVREQLDTVWRTARRLGVPNAELDDVAQEVMLVVVRRIDAIEPDKERAFVAATTVRVTANWRRRQRRHPERPSDALDALGSDPEYAVSRHGLEPGEHCVDRARKLQLLNAALEVMTEPQRVAFILFELEELTAREIAEQLQVPEAAVVSRARRAREAFANFCERHGYGREVPAEAEPVDLSTMESLRVR
jgi:RNA polymerase sigma-70 factor (ECF subfamily)